uniref:SJCHGC04516 protein n=1 Tax=Schistosoma japonicum TaxID=6182 RepID=Q5DAA8_SCHJA|nr:SJCHGC04516 protein [Schistosoma japonicum]
MSDDNFESFLKEKYGVEKIKEATKILGRFPSIPPKWYVDSVQARNTGIDLLNDIYKLSRRRRINSSPKSNENKALDERDNSSAKYKNTLIQSPYIQEEDKETYWIPLDVFKTVSQNKAEDCKKSYS